MSLELLTLHELAMMLRVGLVVEAGRTADGRVSSYALTPAGRALLNNRAAAEHLSEETTTLHERGLTGEGSGAKVKA